jgi:hypothetical protein
MAKRNRDCRQNSKGAPRLKREIHHQEDRARGIERRHQNRLCLRSLSPGFAPWKEAMPEPPNRWLLLIAPGKMAILAVKLLGNNFERAKQTD